jgi:hypothetical protein
VAGANVLRTGVRIELRAWDLYGGLPEGPWDLVVSNPPYVLPDEIDGLEAEVREWEPREALVGTGATGPAWETRRPAAEGVLVSRSQQAMPASCGAARRAGYADDDDGRSRRRTAWSRGLTVSSVDEVVAVEAAAGRRPTDTVYGLACRPTGRRPFGAGACGAAGQPIALVAASVDGLNRARARWAGRAGRSAVPRTLRGGSGSRERGRHVRPYPT